MNTNAKILDNKLGQRNKEYRMTHIEYFKLQAKNLHKDHKTKTPFIDEGGILYKYNPQYFDIDGLLLAYDYDEEKFSLMNAQHIIALMSGFRKWTDLVKGSDIELELAKLIFDNQHKISAEEWDMYILGVENDNNTTFDSESKLEIYKMVFLNTDGHESMLTDYRLRKKG